MEPKKEEIDTTSGYKALEEAYKKLKNDYEEVVLDSEAKYGKIKDLEILVDNLHVKLSENDKADFKLKALQAQFENLSRENKTLKTEDSKMKTQLKKLERKLKETEDQYIETNDSNKALIDEIKVVTAEKKKALIQIKELKVEANGEIVKLEKEKADIGRKLTLLIEKKSEDAPCQTDSHPEIPYEVTSPLPPIFGNQLCWKSRLFHFSKSLPSLDKLCWCKPDYDFTDEAEEALNEQYDRQVREFYEDERDRVRASRLSTLLSEQVKDPGPLLQK